MRLLAAALLLASVSAQADTEYQFTFTHDCVLSPAFCDPAASFTGRVVVAGSPLTGTVSGTALLRLDFFLNDPFPAGYDLNSPSFGHVPSVTFEAGNLTSIDYRAFAWGDASDPFNWRNIWFTASGMSMSYGGLNHYVITEVKAVAPVNEVPEPATYALWLGGITALLGCRRWRQARTARP